MAPKRRIVMGRSSVPTRRRSNVREATPESSSATHEDSPPSPRVDQLAGKTITTGRKVDFHFFDSEGFSIGRLLKEMGWERICSLDLPTYPALVRDFYNDLSRGEGGLVSYVRGIKIVITSQTLGTILEMPTVGLCESQHDDRGGALSRMLGREVNGFEEVMANQLNLELRLLHNICGRILFPKIGRFEYVSERDILLMDCILVGRPVNLAGMMIGYMAESATKKRSTLPYGMVLTLIFRSQGVLISDNEPLRKLRHTDYYSVSTVRRMGFKKENGTWIKRGQEARTEFEEIPEDIPGPSTRPSDAGPSSHPSPPPPPALAPSRFSEEQIEQLRTILAEHDNQRANELSQLKEELKLIKEEISSKLDLISSSINNSVESFSALTQLFANLDAIE